MSFRLGEKEWFWTASGLIFATLILVGIYGYTQLNPFGLTDEGKIELIKQRTGYTFVKLDDFVGGKTYFKAYSYDPDDPSNEDVYGGWVSGYVDGWGRVFITFRS